MDSTHFGCIGQPTCLIVSAPDPTLSSVSLSPNQSHCIVFLDKELHTLPTQGINLWVLVNCLGNLTEFSRVAFPPGCTTWYPTPFNWLQAVRKQQESVTRQALFWNLQGKRKQGRWPKNQRKRSAEQNLWQAGPKWNELETLRYPGFGYGQG